MFLKFIKPTNLGLNKGLSTKYSIYSAFSIEMYRYIVHGSTKSQKEFLECEFRFSHLPTMR